MKTEITRIKRLIAQHGSPEAVAILLSCTARMVEMMRNGKAAPGKARRKEIKRLLGE